ncbi:MAG: GntR family transcriptional regulator [Cellulosilyticaceae bacterium]
MLDKGKGAPTLKEQLIAIIEEEIESGVYGEGDLLPREIDYQEKYDISRITVRAAIGELEQRGYVERIKGKGTLVKTTKVSEPLLKIQGFTEEMKSKGIVPSTKFAHIELTKASSQCAKILEIPEGMPVYLLTRIRCINELPVVRFKTYIKATVNMGLEDNLYYGSFYEYLHQEYGITVKKIKQIITADLADQTLQQQLTCDKGDPILLLKRIGYDQHNQVFEYTECSYVAKRYEYYLELEE